MIKVTKHRIDLLSTAGDYDDQESKVDLQFDAFVELFVDSAFGKKAKIDNRHKN